ncbi:MAG: hypothetical protein ACFB9M_07240 [Myxococcota bacterium]
MIVMKTLLLIVFAQASSSNARIAALEAEVASLKTAIAALRETPGGVYNAAEWIPEGGDLADAVDGIQRDGGCGRTGPHGGERQGCRIFIPRGEYTIGKPIVICRAVELYGVGPRTGSSTIIKADRTTGIHVSSASHCRSLGFPKRASGTQAHIHHLRILDRSVYWKGGTKPFVPIANAGIFLEARASIEDVHVQRFTQGIRISAGAKRRRSVADTGYPMNAGTNANSWYLERVSINQSRHSGLYVDGPDSNAGLGVLVDSSSNCLDADKYGEAGWEPCANFYLSSFLGDTLVQPHSAHSKDRRGNLHFQYYSDNPNSRNVLLGAYAENAKGNGPSHASKNDLVVGGLSRWQPQGGGTRLQDGSINGLCARDDRPDQNPEKAEVCLGTRAGAGAPIALRASGKGFSTHDTLRIKAESGSPVGPVWRADVANLNSAQLFRIATDKKKAGSAGALRFVEPRVLPRCPREKVSPLMDTGIGVLTSPAGVALCTMMKKKR